MELYHKTSFGISKIITQNYSTSFSLGIKIFSREYRNGIYSIYAYVRLADEIVDTFHDHDKASLLKQFRIETYSAIKNGISTNPVIHAFQLTVKEYKIDIKYIDSFLDSMEMDLYSSYYERNVYDKYIYGSAESVGLMCLHVFCKGDMDLFERLCEPARMLGSAFQKVNFLRDIRSDIEERGRIYLPGSKDSRELDNNSKINLEEEVEKEFSTALSGILRLPNGVKLGVYTAYLYYYVLFKKIKALDIRTLLEKRVRVSNIIKFGLLFKSLILIKILRIG
ncbi:MAG: phytoene/squalene synthase family protein [Bacillota bacterium]